MGVKITHLYSKPSSQRCNPYTPLTISVPNRPVRTPGPWRPIVPSVPGRVGKDGRARRPSSIMTAVL